MNATTQLQIEIDRTADDDSKELQELTLRLKEDLLQLELEAVDLPNVERAPLGAKVGDPLSWGTIFVTLAASGGVLTTLIGTIQSWLSRNERHSVKIKIGDDTLEVTNLPSDEQSRLIKHWIQRHRG